jgi:hypothetical protein
MKTLLESYTRLVRKAFFSLSEGCQGVNQWQGLRDILNPKSAIFGINLAQ